MSSSFYLQQLKKKTSLYPLGAKDPKKKLTIMQRYSRASEFTKKVKVEEKV